MRKYNDITLQVHLIMMWTFKSQTNVWNYITSNQIQVCWFSHGGYWYANFALHFWSRSRLDFDSNHRLISWFFFYWSERFDMCLHKQFLRINSSWFFFYSEFFCLEAVFQIKVKKETSHSITGLATNFFCAKE